MAMAIDSARRKGVRVSGANIAEHTKNFSFPGFNHWVETDNCGKGLSSYVILDTDGHGNQLFPTHLLDMSSDSVMSLGQAIHFPRGGPPKQDSSCWFDPDVLCTGGKKEKKKNHHQMALGPWFLFISSFLLLQGKVPWKENPKLKKFIQMWPFIMLFVVRVLYRVLTTDPQVSLTAC